jgi:deoxyribodipyrimidine photolyase-related protein
VRNLVLILGDQLDPNSSAFDHFDPTHDAAWMAEVTEESTHVWSHKARIAIFLAAMRHFRDNLQSRGIPLHYRTLDAPGNRGTLAAELAHSIAELQPQRLIVTEPGDYRVLQSLQQTAAEAGIPLEIRPDRHFLCSLPDFREWSEGRKQLRLEFFYRWMRQRTGILMEGRDPAGGNWNFDTDNRASFPKSGPPGLLPAPRAFPPDPITQDVLTLVQARFPEHPGSLAHFNWPVTREQALLALDDFITHRLPLFGRFQDAMWTAQPWLYHSCLSAALNLKLLSPAEVIEAAVDAWKQRLAPIESVEGFVRQILGWREFVRGVYWTQMPDYAQVNALDAQAPLPAFYWTADTDMRCLRESLQQTLDYGYAHHIQRLMVTGLYAQLAGIEPRQIHEWYLAVYVDAVEWVELPNVIGMSQFADGGRMSSKPYIATGKYIQRMSNYCTGCRYNPAKSTGPDACPFTTLYWNFLDQHQSFLRTVPRMELQLRNLDRLSEAERVAIRNQAAAHLLAAT